MSVPADDSVLISSLQHYLFCPKQFAIIHVEQYWKENFFTADGRRLHERVDLPGNHRQSGSRVEYALPLLSRTYGLSGKADAVEFRSDGKIVPVEYKRGHDKVDDCDRVQLCAQALCLEEMLSVVIGEGALFYFENREKVMVPITDELRETTVSAINGCRSILSGNAPLFVPEKGQKCRACSLAEYCMPVKGKRSASDYLRKEMEQCGNY